MAAKVVRAWSARWGLSGGVLGCRFDPHLGRVWEAVSLGQYTETDYVMGLDR